MSALHNGGPAFPDGGQADYTGGMSLRDWFAGQTLSGMNAYNGLATDDYTAQKRAQSAYAQADAMLVARRGKVGP